MPDEAKVRGIRDYDAGYARLVERGVAYFGSSHGKTPGGEQWPSEMKARARRDGRRIRTGLAQAGGVWAALPGHPRVGEWGL